MRYLLPRRDVSGFDAVGPFVGSEADTRAGHEATGGSNTDTSSPVAALITSATLSETRGIVTWNPLTARKGCHRPLDTLGERNGDTGLAIVLVQMQPHHEGVLAGKCLHESGNSGVQGFLLASPASICRSRSPLTIA